MQLVIRSSQILTGGRFIPADIAISGSIISSIEPYKSLDSAIDMGNMKIVPGFVDLHSDAIEKEIEPRPGARFPLKAAVMNLDKKLGLSGITTMFHAVGFNDEELTKNRRGTEKSAELVNEIYFSNKRFLNVDNYIHTRFEITSRSSINTVKKLISEHKINMLSLMDHSPGQGQFKTLESWKKYHLSAYSFDIENIEKYIEKKLSSDKTGIVEELVKFARSYNIPVLSHDDDCKEKLNTLKNLGITFSEFPLSIEVAEYAKSLNISTGMGAPNVVRGGSQSGNIAAKELISKNLCDYLCSDYHPSSMLLAPYKLQEDLNIPLEKGLQLVSTNPAQLAGLKDRGIIAIGKKADLIVIDESYTPNIVFTIKNGKPIYNGINNDKQVLNHALL
ncbi:alpha-D-ribose 1-methylphosphonate 5-triphosphate diphosphatase [Flexistipes sp.]|uniref:alpha-D-ribose 1-methylphosphonate 5-triphosphate diphosphatase n=1 Tax=Flexistipes sp. TaxID=3088135 RepID=UPI002E1D9B3D|nr:alpha-D-ribose 1-methylphosphonate 5-triphosphate diphosphatase [Flexistipes sp.]